MIETKPKNRKVDPLL